MKFSGCISCCQRFSQFGSAAGCNGEELARGGMGVALSNDGQSHWLIGLTLLDFSHVSSKMYLAADRTDGLCLFSW
jgi:hypothetical protein